MTLAQLKSLIRGAELIAEGDAVVCINDSRDGITSFPEAEARFMQDDLGRTILVIGYA